MYPVSYTHLDVYKRQVHDIVATLIYSGDHKAVDTVVINGNTGLEDGRFLLADEKEILDDAQLMAEDLVRCIQENQG